MVAMRSLAVALLLFISIAARADAVNSINACASNPCQRGGTCTDYVLKGRPAYSCECPNGFNSENCAPHFATQLRSQGSDGLMRDALARDPVSGALYTIVQVSLDADHCVYPTSYLDSPNYSLDGDLVLVKLAANGTREWTRVAGSNKVDSVRDVAVSPTGSHVTVVGFCDSSVDGQPYISNQDYCAVTYASDGVKLWTRLWGTTSSDWPNTVAIDDDLNGFIGGSMAASFDSQPAYGNNDWSVIKFDARTGFEQWARMSGSSGSDILHALAPTYNTSGTGITDGGIVCTGTANGVFNGLPNVGAADIAIIRYDTAGNTLWTKIYGGAGNEVTVSIHATSDGLYLYVAGFTSDLAWASPVGTIPGGVGNVDWYLLKLNAITGDPISSRAFGSATADMVTAMAFDDRTNTGVISGQLFANFPFYDRVSDSIDIGAIKFDSSLNPIWTTRFGSNQPDNGGGLVLDGSGNPIISYYGAGANGPYSGIGWSSDVYITNRMANLVPAGFRCNASAVPPYGVHECTLTDTLVPCPAGFSCPLYSDEPIDCSLYPNSICTNSTFSLCPAGLSGNGCTVNADDCNPDPCLNGGSCADGLNTYTCACPAGYSGVNCQTLDVACSPACANGGTCTSAVCVCAKGWSGASCETNINECASSPCRNGGTCVDGVGAFTCICPPNSPFRGVACTTPTQHTRRLPGSATTSSNGNWAGSVLTDNAGNFWEVGFTDSKYVDDRTAPCKPPASMAMFASKFDAYANRVWTRSVGSRFLAGATTVAAVDPATGSLVMLYRWAAFREETFQPTQQPDGSTFVGHQFASIAVIKLDENGNEAFAKKLGATTVASTPFGVAVLPGGDVLVVAYSSIGLSGSGTCGSTSCLVLGRLNGKTGALIAAPVFGQTEVLSMVWSISAAATRSVAVDAARNRVYVTALFLVTSTPDVHFGFGLGTQTITSNLNVQNTFVVALTADTLTPVWYKIYCSSASNVFIPTELIVDSAGALYLTGYTSGTVVGGVAVPNAGTNDWAILKLDSNAGGAVTWARAMGGPGTDLPYGLALTVDESAIVVSGFIGATTTFNGVSVTCTGALTCGTVVSLSASTGASLWTHVLATDGHTKVQSIAIDRFGQTVISGHSESVNLNGVGMPAGSLQSPFVSFGICYPVEAGKFCPPASSGASEGCGTGECVDAASQLFCPPNSYCLFMNAGPVPCGTSYAVCNSTHFVPCDSGKFGIGCGSTVQASSTTLPVPTATPVSSSAQPVQPVVSSSAPVQPAAPSSSAPAAPTPQPSSSAPAAPPQPVSSSAAAAPVQPPSSSAAAGPVAPAGSSTAVSPLSQPPSSSAVGAGASSDAFESGTGNRISSSAGAAVLQTPPNDDPSNSNTALIVGVVVGGGGGLIALIAYVWYRRTASYTRFSNQRTTNTELSSLTATVPGSAPAAVATPKPTNLVEVSARP